MLTRLDRFAVLPRAGTPAPQCGTGVLARQIAENGVQMSKLQAGASAPVTDDSKSAPYRRARVSRRGLKMIRRTGFAEKSDQALRFFVLNRSLRAASPRPSGTGIPFCF